jgi:zinc protease
MVRIAVLLAALLCILRPAYAVDRVERFELPNGLTVLVGVEPRLPLVNVTCLYRVGSANERPGITGIAHYVEHMAFRATENISKADITGTIERIGGRWNGYTYIDQTLYAATVPTWALDSVLHIEAERMSRALFDPTEFERERTSVIAELQGYENDPASILWDLTVASSFEIHPYRYNVIGWLTDVASIERDEAYRFYRDYYGPSNAVLSIVGDVDPDEILENVEAHFGSLPPSRRSAEVRVVEPAQKGEKRVELEYPGSRSSLLFLFRAPNATEPDFAALLLLDVILAGGRGLSFGSREASASTPLQKAIEPVGGITASTSLTPSRAPYVYGIAVSAGEKADLDKLEESIDEVLGRLGTEGPSEPELARARRQIRAEVAHETDTLAQMAHRLAYYEALGSWEQAETTLTALDQVTAADIQAVARNYLQPAQRTVGRHTPAKLNQGKKVEIPEVKLPDPVIPPPSPVPELALKPLGPSRLITARKSLPNGAAVRVVSRDGRTASLRLRLAFGSALDPPGKEGLALVGARAILGDERLTSRLSELGARSESTAFDAPAFSNREYFDLSIHFLPENLSEVVEEVARALAKRDMSASEIDRIKSRLGEERAFAISDAAFVATDKAIKLTNPSWQPPFGTERSLETISSKDVEAFVSEHLVGGAVILGLASSGDTTSLLDTAAKALAHVPSGQALLPRVPVERPPPDEAMAITSEIEGKTQAEIVAALPGVERGHPDHQALQLLNYILGETGYAGRLGRKLVDSGLTYSVYAEPQFGRAPGPLLIYTSTAPANLEESLSRIRTVLDELATQGVEQREWREAQAFRLGRLTVGIDSIDAIALALIEAEYFGENEDRLDFEARSKDILSVTRRELNEVARRYLRPELLRVGVAGAIPENP